MSNQALAVVQPTDTVVYQEKAAWELMRDQAQILVKTGFLPEAIKTPEQAMAVMMKGRELRIPPMYALANIAIVKGKPSCSAELMLALIRRDHGPQAIRVKDTTNGACTVEWRQAGWDGTQTYTFTIDDAKQAGLLKNATWTQYPAAMLRARCISAVARMQFPECIAGMYSPGELGEDVVVTDEGEVMSEVETVPAARTVTVDTETGEIIDAQPAQSAPDAPGRTERVSTAHHTTPRANVSQRDDDEPARTDGGATIRSLRKSLALAHEAGISDDDVYRWIGDQFGKESRRELNQREMGVLIDWLDALPKAVQATAPSEPQDLNHDEHGNILNWSQFWAEARKVGVATPADYEARVGAKQTAYPSPAAALAALAGAEQPTG